MSSADLHDTTSSPGDRLRTVPVPSSPPDPQPSTDDVLPLGPVGRNAATARSFLRRQPVHIAEGRIEGGYTNVFEVICRDCGDDPLLNYAEVSPRLQRLRGPYTLHEGVAAYQAHLASD